ncbi:MAG: TIGR02266 family protein [Labilithrix sp.]|nr:TIGR02266 family protein [Labilithrix sp.]
MVEAKDDERRDGDRAPITLRVDYKRLNTFFADYTKNISKGGTFIRTGRPLEVGTEFMFVLSLPAPKAESQPDEPRDTVQLELKGVVKWVVSESAATEEAPAGMGIQFVFEQDDKRLAVEAVVSKMMHDALGPHLAGKLLRGA